MRSAHVLWRHAFALWLTGSCLAPVQAQTVVVREQHKLSVDWIMQGEDLVGTAPSRLRWSADGRTLYFVWKPPGERVEGLYKVDAEGGDPERVPEDRALELEPRLNAVFSRDRSLAAFSDEGDLYLLDVRAGRERLLYSAPGRISNLRIEMSGGAVFFVRDDNLYRVEISTGTVSQLTDIRRGSKPRAPKEPEGQELFLREQQRELLQVFAADSIRRAQGWPPPPDTAAVDTPQAFYVAPRGERLSGFWVAPDGSRMAFALSEESEEARDAWVPDYVTEDGYTEQAPRKRTFVGDEQGSSKLGLMDLTSGEVIWVDHGQDDREVTLYFRGWSKGSGRLLAVGLADDMHDRWILLVDAASGASTVLDRLHDEAWIGGPGWSSAGWMPDDDHIWYISEATGFAHLYTVAVGGGEPNPLTTGPWEVLSADLSADEDEWYLLTSEPSPHERGFYRMNIDGSERRLVTGHASLQGSGRGEPAVVSPDGRRLAALYGWPDRPAELFLQNNREGAKPRQITKSTTTDFDSYDWYVPEIVYFASRAGGEVPARLYRPGRPNGAGVIFVHGAGYMQNVHDWWSSYYREYMFHNLLAERGYAVLDIDYRGSAGYGRDWRTAIHKHMGGVDLSDQLDGARYLVDELGVEPHRIGIYGGSYGGFLTLMAMFTEPGAFAAGAALRPVTDWAYYNHWYTSRILGLPQDDAAAYRRSSPIYHAQGLEGALLICHGMIDQNVHFQDTVRLVQRLIELGKKNWEVAIYPKEDHGFRHPWSWSDEYRRILQLFEENLN